MKKKILLSALALLLAISLVAIGCPAPTPTLTEDTYHWRLGHCTTPGSLADVDLHLFADEVIKNSGGRITMTIYPAGQLGDYEKVQELVSLGAIEMQMEALGTKADPRLQLSNLVYLTPTWESALEAYSPGGYLMDVIDGLLAEQNIHLIATWPNHIGGMIFAVEDVPKPGDPNVDRGHIKMRCPPQKQYELLLDRFGYLGTPLPWSDVFTSLQSGVIDGLVGCGSYYAGTFFGDIIKTFVAYNEHFEQKYLYINAELWDSLSQKDQTIIQNAATQMLKRRFPKAAEEDEYNLQFMRDNGVNVITLTPEELEACTKAAREDVWPQLRESIGAELLDEVITRIIK